VTAAPTSSAPAAAKEFSPEAQEAIRTQSVSGSWELRKLQKLFAELATFDERNEAAVKKAKGSMTWAIVGTIASLFAGVAILGVFDTGLGFLLPVGGVALSIVLGRKWSALKKADLIDDFRICLRPGLRDIAQDLDPEKKIRVRMDLAGPVDRKKTSELQLPPGRNRKLTETIFQDPWCEVRLPMMDGSTAVLEFEVCWKKRVRDYRTSRGKYKSKTKWRKECTAVATLLPAAAVNWNQAALQSHLDPGSEKAKLVEKENLTGARMEKCWTYKGLSDPPKDAPPAREVVGMLLRLYAAMKPAPEVSK
jgi:hypothetical protein